MCDEKDVMSEKIKKHTYRWNTYRKVEVLAIQNKTVFFLAVFKKVKNFYGDFEKSSRLFRRFKTYKFSNLKNMFNFSISLLNFFKFL